GGGEDVRAAIQEERDRSVLAEPERNRDGEWKPGIGNRSDSRPGAEVLSGDRVLEKRGSVEEVNPNESLPRRLVLGRCGRRNEQHAAVPVIRQPDRTGWEIVPESVLPGVLRGRKFFCFSDGEGPRSKRPDLDVEADGLRDCRQHPGRRKRRGNCSENTRGTCGRRCGSGMISRRQRRERQGVKYVYCGLRPLEEANRS